MNFFGTKVDTESMTLKELKDARTNAYQIEAKIRKTIRTLRKLQPVEVVLMNRKILDELDLHLTKSKIERYEDALNKVLEVLTHLNHQIATKRKFHF